MRTVPPSGAAARYTRALLDMDAELASAIARAVEEVGLAPERTDAAADGAPGAPADPEKLRRLRERLRAITEGLGLYLRRPLEVLRLVEPRVVAHTEAEWKRQLAALGVSLDDVDAPDVRALRTTWRKHNLGLIRALAADKVKRVERVLLQHKGARVETLARRIQEATGTGEGHARLLARDQTLKLAGEVTQARHQAAGVTEYVWRTSRDERVRRRHKDLDGTRQSYAEPPVVDVATGRREHPGADYQCRCTADPILPGLE